MELDSVVVATREQTSCDLDSEMVILSLETGEYFGLDPVGASIWKHIQTPCTVRELRDALLAEYDAVSPDECLDGVVALLEEMEALRLVQRG